MNPNEYLLKFVFAELDSASSTAMARGMRLSTTANRRTRNPSRPRRRTGTAPRRYCSMKTRSRQDAGGSQGRDLLARRDLIRGSGLGTTGRGESPRSTSSEALAHLGTQSLFCSVGPFKPACAAFYSHLIAQFHTFWRSAPERRICRTTAQMELTGIRPPTLEAAD